MEITQIFNLCNFISRLKIKVKLLVITHRYHIFVIKRILIETAEIPIIAEGKLDMPCETSGPTSLTSTTNECLLN